jgi:hypothetical protein
MTRTKPYPPSVKLEAAKKKRHVPGRGIGKETKPAAPPADSPPLKPEEIAEVRRYIDRRSERGRAPRYTVEPDGECNVVITPVHSDQGYAAIRLQTIFGTTEPAFAERLLMQIINAVRLDASKPTDERAVNAALAAVAGIVPRDETEGMLAAQMIATHWLAMNMLRQAGITTMRLHLQDAGNLAVKLLRTYTTQLEALQRYRGKAVEQKVTVEHVHVHAGGQAIVGAVTSAPGGLGKVEEQSDAKQIAYAPEPALRSADAALDAVPITRDDKR